MVSGLTKFRLFAFKTIHDLISAAAIQFLPHDLGKDGESVVESGGGLFVLHGGLSLLDAGFELRHRQVQFLGFGGRHSLILLVIFKLLLHLLDLCSLFLDINCIICGLDTSLLLRFSFFLRALFRGCCSG